MLLIIMTEESILLSYSARVLDTVGETVLPVIPNFVWDGILWVVELAREISSADLQYQVLIGLLSWLFVNILLIKLAWMVFGEDTIRLSRDHDRPSHLKKE